MHQLYAQVMRHQCNSTARAHHAFMHIHTDHACVHVIQTATQIQINVIIVMITQQHDVCMPIMNFGKCCVLRIGTRMQI